MSTAVVRHLIRLVWRAVASLIFVVPCVSAAGQDADPHAQHRQMMQKQASIESKASSADIDVPDVNLLTQHGKSVNLRTDVVGDKIVVLDFVYTTCTTICPVLSAILGQVQGELADRLGEEVVLVSLTVDPLRDTPARLKAYSANHRAGDGWFWLTGDKQTIDDVLRDFGVYTPNFQDHPSTVLIGDGGSGEWSRFIGFPSTGKLMDKINEFSAARLSQLAAKE